MLRFGFESDKKVREFSTKAQRRGQGGGEKERNDVFPKSIQIATVQCIDLARSILLYTRKCIHILLYIRAYT